jgi:hypothetical protein
VVEEIYDQGNEVTKENLIETEALTYRWFVPPLLRRSFGIKDLATTFSQVFEE